MQKLIQIQFKSTLRVILPFIALIFDVRFRSATRKLSSEVVLVKFRPEGFVVSVCVAELAAHAVAVVFDAWLKLNLVLFCENFEFRIQKFHKQA